MAQNTGKPSEKIWEDSFARQGKRAFTHRFVDAAEIKGKTGKVAVGASPQPSDFLLVNNGLTFFCEVKSTQNETSFPFSMLRTTQSAMAKMILAAGGGYRIYIHSLALDQWFCIPYQVVLDVKAAGASSIKWPILAPYQWTP